LHVSDLQVTPLSHALKGCRIDLVICGSIGAVESVRFIRALRRLGAHVTPWLTRSATQFITPTSVGWAADAPVRETFSAQASHVADADACIIAPASAAMLAKIAHGVTDTPASALIASWLGSRDARGQKRPVILVPNMHDSMANSPGVRENLERIRPWLTVLDSRREEGKNKFPDPATLADVCAHHIRRQSNIVRPGVVGEPGVLVSLGSTRGYIDDVRYVSNYSSGKLGSEIAEEIYRQGIATHVVAGSALHIPRAYGSLTRIETNAELAAACDRIVAAGAQASVLAASVLDFIPETRVSGKISSSTPSMDLKLKPTEKIIARVKTGIKVGFKLESSLTAESAANWAGRYIPGYGLTMMVLNALTDVDASRHTATVFETSRPGDFASARSTVIEGKTAVAHFVARHVTEQLIDV
jgi:phosphopantothenoylcysteine decarboxylase/phosphopantothenate--cysteine ligase